MSSQEPFRWHYAEFGDSNFQISGRPLLVILLLVSLVLLIGLIFIYTRWLCRFIPPSLPAPAPVAASAPLTRGLDASAIRSLPIELYRTSSPTSGCGFCETECCICLGIFGDGDKVKVLPFCRHRFHSACLGLWLTAHSTCPLCRSSLRFDSSV